MKSYNHFNVLTKDMRGIHFEVYSNAKYLHNRRFEKQSNGNSDKDETQFIVIFETAHHRPKNK